MQFPLLTVPLSWQGPMHFHYCDSKITIAIIAISILSLSTNTVVLHKLLALKLVSNCSIFSFVVLHIASRQRPFLACQPLFLHELIIVQLRRKGSSDFCQVLVDTLEMLAEPIGLHSSQLLCNVTSHILAILDSSLIAAMELKKVLTKVAHQMGYSELRPKQEAVVLDLVRGSDVFISLPNGNGKFLCYSLLPAVDEVHCLPGFFVISVVSPLVALMRDQVRAMAERNVHTVYVGDTCDDFTVDLCWQIPARLYESGVHPDGTCSRVLLTRRIWWELLLIKLTVSSNG